MPDPGGGAGPAQGERPEDLLVDSILAGRAPRAVRLAAARGALPVPRASVLRLLVALVPDGDEEIRLAAGASLGAWTQEELQQLAADPDTGPAVLEYLLRSPAATPRLLEIVLSHPGTPVDAILEAARTFDPPGLDALLLNQTLLIQHPELLDAAEANPAATPSHRARLVEIRRHFFRAPSRPDPAPEAAPGAPIPAHETPPPFPAVSDEAPPASGQPTPEAPALLDEGPEHEGAMQRIFKMNVGEKIGLAAKGTREERSLLIRDSNRSVQDAVINSPKLSESEVETIAKMRNVNEDILRQIAGHRDWMKSYAVLLGLATNPKTPIGIAMSLLARLNTQDLKSLQNDKNVSEAIRRTARKHVEARVAGPRSAGRGGH
ncbi:MAG: hypothetical protein HY049_04135 [Acidobacteria bacterium]|nr:hypothetical protein [Acidobacteriota bacterium]